MVHGLKRRRLSLCCTKGSAATLRRDSPPRLVGAYSPIRAGYRGSDPVDLTRPLDYMSREARPSMPAVLEAIQFQGGILLGHGDAPRPRGPTPAYIRMNGSRASFSGAPCFHRRAGPRLGRGGATRL
jgi:hypothetical protein